MIRLLALTLTLAGTGAAAEWRPVTWRGEAAWAADQGVWTAVVSWERCRLVALDHRDGRSLLFVPREAPGSLPANGGHQAWLGPQAAWRWPPPAAWERLPARAQSLVGDELVLQGDQDDAAWPALERRYAWVGARLRLTVAWRCDGVPRHCLQVLQVPVDAQVALAATPGPGLPEGAGLRYGWGRYQPDPLVQPFPPGVERRDGLLLLGPAADQRKLYVAPQPITARRAGLRLVLHPGPGIGTRLGQPDHGLTTQVYHQPGKEYGEIEQISDDLGGPAGARLESRVELEPGLE
ncbi:MAG: hypothetical protein L6R48_02470 [Planctomycetes bacterium]|nr:hypothetical protein [Planctomycetota bacterium]